VGQRVEDGDLVVGRGQHVPDVVGTDEPGSAGDEQTHPGHPPVERVRPPNGGPWGRSSDRDERSGGPCGTGTSERSAVRRRSPGQRWVQIGRRPNRATSQSRSTSSRAYTRLARNDSAFWRPLRRIHSNPVGSSSTSPRNDTRSSGSAASKKSRPGSSPLAGDSVSLMTRFPTARCSATRFSKLGYGSLWTLIATRNCRAVSA